MSEQKEEVVENSDTTPNASKSSENKNKTKVISIIIVLIIVIAGIVVFKNNTSSKPDSGKTTTSEANKDNTSSIVAKVNGVEILSNDVDNQTQALINSSLPPGVTDVPAELETEARKQALQIMINQEVLYQTAVDSGVEVSDEDVQSQIDSIIQRFPSEAEYKTALAADNISEDILRQDIKKQLTVQKYVDTVVDTDGITASEEEIQALYDKYAEAQENMPALEEIQEQLQAEIVQGKFNTQISAIIDQLREQADIEIL